MVSTTKQTPSLRQLTDAASSSVQFSLGDVSVVTSGNWAVSATVDDRRFQQASDTATSRNYSLNCLNVYVIAYRLYPNSSLNIHLRGTFHKSVTKRHHSVNVHYMKNPKYAFCGEYYNEYQIWVLFWWRHCDVIYRHQMRWRCHSKYPIRNNILFSFTVGQKTWHKCHSPLDVTIVYSEKCFTRSIMHILIQEVCS